MSARAPRLTGATAQMLDAVLNVRTPHETIVSPDGERLAVTVSRRGDDVHPHADDIPAGLPSSQVGRQVLVVDAEAGAPAPAVPGAVGSWMPSWSPDGQQLACLAHDGKAVGIWVSAVDGNEPRCVFDGPLAVASRGPQWTHDGRGLIFLIPSQVAPAAPLDAARDPAPAVDVLFSPARDGGPPPMANPRSDLMDLVVLDVQTGTVAPLATSVAIDSFSLSPDRRRVALLSRGVRRSRQFATERTLTILEVATGAVSSTVEGMTALGSGSAGPSWSPDSDRVAFIRNGSAVVHIVGDGEVEVAGPGTFVDTGLWALLWTQDGQHLIGIDTWDATGRLLIGMEGPPHLWSMNLADSTFAAIALPEGCGLPEVFQRSGSHTVWQRADGRVAVVTRAPDTRLRELWWAPLDGAPAERAGLPPEQLPHPGGFYVGMAHADIAPDGRAVFYRAESERVPPEIWTMTVEGRTRRLTELNEGLFTEPLPPARLLRWQDERGEECIGSVVMPPDHDGSSAVPVVVDTYPMPHWADWHDDWEGLAVIFRHVLLAEGYAVFTPSMTELPKLYWQRPDLDRFIVSGLDELVRQGVADDRFAIMGMSGGGYMVNAVITTTTRFKAAVSGVGFANLSSWFGQVFLNPDGVGITHGVTGGPNIAGGAPWEVPEAYVENSPVFHLDHVETPLLIFHSDNDRAARPSQGHEMFVGLKYLGKEVTALAYHREGHGPMWYTEPNRTDLIERVLDLFRRHLGTDGMGG